MGRKLKWVLGVALVVLAVVGAGYFLFAPPDMPITVDDPGEGGERVVLNDRPANFFPRRAQARIPLSFSWGDPKVGCRKA